MSRDEVAGEHGHGNLRDFLRVERGRLRFLGRFLPWTPVPHIHGFRGEGEASIMRFIDLSIVYPQPETEAQFLDALYKCREK